MKNSEIMTTYYDKILEAMTQNYADVIRSRGRIQVSVYIWSDGEIETLTDAQGSSMRLYPREMETRTLVPVATLEAPCFDIWDFSNDPKPEDEEEAEKMEEELIDWYLSEGVQDQMRATLDGAIEDAEMRERYDF